jgi:tripartite ATP-independent transporter DctM subunit
MSPELIGCLGLLLLLALLTLGTPIAAALVLVGAGGTALLLSPEAALIKSGVIAFDTISRYELGVLPLFLLMAHLCFSAGASRDFFTAASKFVGHRPGGLALASIGACAGFGAISGSSLATAATVGAVALPEMRKQGYSPALATGALAAGGTLGSLVPPSGALIVFGIIAEQSIGKLFVASLIPAATQALFYMAAIYLMCRFKPELGPASPRASWRERGVALRRVWDLGLLILLVIGGLAVGWFTPTEAASVGAVGAFALCAWRRTLSAASVAKAIRDTLRTSGMIYAVIIGALIFSTFISLSGITRQLSEAVAGLHAGPVVGLIAMAAVLLLLGSFLDGMALMLLTTPIFLPIAVKLGVSPIWFGIFLVRTMEIGLVHPPVGMNVYVIHGLAKDIPLTTIFRGIVPFLLTDFLHLALLIAVPAMTLFLPSVLGG